MQTSCVHARNPIRPQMLATSFRGGSSADSADKGLFRSLRTIQLYVALGQGRRLCGTTWVTSNIGVTQNCTTSDEGRTVTLESPLNKLWIENEQCAFALWFLQLL